MYKNLHSSCAYSVTNLRGSWYVAAERLLHYHLSLQVLLLLETFSEHMNICGMPLLTFAFGIAHCHLQEVCLTMPA